MDQADGDAGFLGLATVGAHVVRGLAAVIVAMRRRGNDHARAQLTGEADALAHGVAGRGIGRQRRGAQPAGGQDRLHVSRALGRGVHVSQNRGRRPQIDVLDAGRLYAVQGAIQRLRAEQERRAREPGGNVVDEH